MKQYVLILILICLAAIQVQAEDSENITIELNPEIDLLYLDLACNDTQFCQDAITVNNGKGELAWCDLRYSRCVFPQSTGGFNFSWQIIALIISTMVFLAFMFWMQSKQPKQRKQLPDPILITVVGTAGIFFIMLIAEVVNFLPEGSIKKYWWAILIAMVGIYLGASIYIKKYIAKTIDEHKDMIVRRLWKDDGARPYRGHGVKTPWITYKVDKSKEENGYFNKVVNILVFGLSTNCALYLYTLDYFTSEPTFYKKNPELDEIQRYFGKSAITSPDLQAALQYREFIDADMEESKASGDMQ